MKKTLRTLLCMILAIGLMLSVVGCGKSTGEDTSSDVNWEECTLCPDKNNCCGCWKYGDCICGQEEQNDVSKDDETDSKPTGNSNQNTSTKFTVPKELRGTTLEIYDWNPASDVTGMQTAINEFKKVSGIKIKYTQANYDNYNTSLAQRVAANNSPDIVRLRAIEPARTELLQPLANSGYDFSDPVWDAELMKYYTVKGKAYGANLKNTLVQDPQIYVYNTKLIDKYDLENPYDLWKAGKWTFEKFIEIAKDYTEQSKKYAITGNYLYPFLTGFEGAIQYKDGKFVNNLKDTEFVSAMKKSVGYKVDGIYTGTWDSDGFEKGEYLFFFQNINTARRTDFHYTNMKAEGTLGVVPAPTVAGKDYSVAFAEYRAFGIAKGAKNVKAAPYYIRYVMDANNYDEKTFFCNNNALEVYKYVMGQKNRIVNNARINGTMEADDSEMCTKLYGAGVDQVNTIIGQYANKLDSAVAELNKKLGEIK